MQDGAARLLQRHLFGEAATSLSSTERRVFQNAYNHLTSRDPAKTWTSGQWMTERTGGSDVSQTETIATYDPYPTSSPTPLADTHENIPLGPWSISGFKWFSSATDSQMTILLAKTDPAKGVSAFLAPMRRHDPTHISAMGVRGGSGGSELNGVTIQRLKRKFGTQSLPTAELELKNMRGWLIGEEGKGIHEISTILNITRVHTAVSSVGYLGRGLGVARGFALVREVGVGRGRRVPLASHPLHMRTLANLTMEYHGLMLLVFYTVHLLGLSEKHQHSPSSPSPPPHPLTPPPALINHLLRVFSSLHKSHASDRALPLLYACMQALGGVGYLLNDETPHANLARIYRDACVGAIWEGTTDVLAGDTIRAVKHPKGGKGVSEGLRWVVETGLGYAEGEEKTEKEWVESVRAVWEKVKGNMEHHGQEELLPEARGVVFRLSEVLIAVLYLVDAATHPGPEIEEMCRRYLVEKGFVSEEEGEGKKDLAMDQAIVYGAGKTPGVVVAGTKL